MTARTSEQFSKQNEVHTIENDNLVRRIHVQALAERERDRVIIQRRVRRAVVRRDRRVRKPRDELLDPAEALHACDGRAERGIVPEVQVEPARDMRPNAGVVSCD